MLLFGASIIVAICDAPCPPLCALPSVLLRSWCQPCACDGYVLVLVEVLALATVAVQLWCLCWFCLVAVEVLAVAAVVVQVF